MAYITTYQDLFPSSTIMRQAPGNGTITVPGAGDARLYAPNSVNCEFYIGASAGKPPLLYERLGVMWQSSHPSQPLFLETKLSVFTGTTNYRIAGLAIFTDAYSISSAGGWYSYQFGWYKSTGKIHAWYDYPNTEVEIFTAVTAVDPATTPHIYRIYWNPYSRPLYIAEISTLLQSDALAFAFSVDNGVTWTSLGARARDFNLVNSYGGLYVRKWETTAVNAQADFAYFKAQEYDPANFSRTPDAYGRNQDRAAFEDAGVLLNESSAGARFDSPSDIKDSATIRDGEPRASFEDDYLLPIITGRDTRFDYPQIKDDYPSPPARSSIEEAYFVQLDATDYIKGKYDADGKEYLGNYAAKHVLYYDATLDPWHTHGAGFYGAGRDGVLYYDGVACGPGNFGTLASGVRRTAWAIKGGFTDIGISVDPTITADGELQCSLIAGQSSSGVQSSLRWFFTGDFDVQMDYQIVSSGSGPTDGGIYLFAYMDPNNAFYVRRHMWGSAVYDKDVRNNGSWVSYASAATSHTSGKVRLTRTGSVVAAFYWTGSAWAQIGGNYTMTYARPLFIACLLSPAGGTTSVTVKLSNFTINSGATTNLIGWAREVAGTYRGSQAAFPQHALIVSSGNSLDIIDVDTDKLWMSFRGGATKLLGGDGNYYVPQVAFKDGTLLLCYRTLDTIGTVDGYGYWIDFTLDFARCHRGPSYNDAGFYYNVELTTGVWPTDSANGAISWRNSNRGESASHYDNWQFQNNRANWADLFHDGGYQYRLIANNGGVYAAKWQRWRLNGIGNAHLNTPDYGISTRTEAIRWVAARPASKDLLYHNRVYLWISHWSNWGAVIGGGGGTWTEDHEYSLAGTVDGWSIGALAQDSMALDDSAGLLFYARDQGVYAMDLATGTSTLFYGKVGSGATHEVLPEYGTVSSIKLATDGVTSLILVGMARPDRIWAVNRATHAIYWRGFQDDGHQPLSMAVGA